MSCLYEVPALRELLERGWDLYDGPGKGTNIHEGLGKGMDLPWLFMKIPTLLAVMYVIRSL